MPTSRILGHASALALLVRASRPASRAAAASVASVAFVAACAEGVARAEAPPADLLARLATHAARFEAMRTRASYAIEGKLEKLAGDGAVDSTTEVKARMVADGKDAVMKVERYREDGEDKLAEAQERARDRAKQTREEREKRELRMPFGVREQPRYSFTLLEADARDPSRVRIGFVPKEATKGALEGSAWVDVPRGAVLSAGFKLAKTSLFIDYIHVTVEFGADTALGPAVSRVAFEGKGGVLFFRKRFRGSATLTDYAIVP